MKNKMPWEIVAPMMAAIIVLGGVGVAAINYQEGIISHDRSVISQLHREQNSTSMNETITLQTVQNLYSYYNVTTAYVQVMYNLTKDPGLNTSQYVNYLEANTTFILQDVPEGTIALGSFPYLQATYGQAIEIFYNSSSLPNGTAKLDSITLHTFSGALYYDSSYLAELAGIVASANVTGQNVSDSSTVNTLLNELVSGLGEITAIKEQILFLEMEER